MSKLLFVFLDGVGLAEKSSNNPFSIAKTSFIEQLLGDKLISSCADISQEELVFKKIDANLDVGGLPQSATGQTAILCGKNASKVIGNHYGPQPGPSLKKIIDESNIFLELKQSAKSVNLLNVYPPAYFKQKRLRESAIVYAYKTTNQKLNDLESYKKQQSVSVDLSGEYLEKILPELSPISAFEMGQRAAIIANDFDFSFFDYWPTDVAGHRSSPNEAISLIETLDSFLAGVHSELKDLTLVISSDHGNLEDKSTKSHTRNKVPLIVIGKGAGQFKNVRSIVDLARPIKEVVLGV